MGLRIVKGPQVGPPTAMPYSIEARHLIGTAQQLMHSYPYRADTLDLWLPNFSGECQQKSTAALIWLYQRGLPLEAMRGYVGEALIQGDWVLHAVLVVRMVDRSRETDYALDDNQSGVRTLSWGENAGQYRGMAPAMKIEEVSGQLN